MATPRRKPATPAGKRKTAASPKRKITVKPTPSKAVPGSKGSFTAQMRVREAEVNPKAAVAQEDPNSFNSVTKDLRAIYGGTKVHVLDVPWDERGVALAMGAELVDRIRQYVYKGSILPMALHKYKSVDYSLNRWLEDQINKSYAPNVPPVLPLFDPRPHQQEAIDDIRDKAKAGWRGYIEADLTGLGKSIAGLLGASEAAKMRGFTAQRKAKLLILAPKAALPHWRNTVKQSKVDNLRVMVINYDQYKRLLTVPKSAETAKKTRTKNKQIASKGKSFIKWDVIISDESHKMKNLSAQRTQAFETIANYSAPASKAPFVIWMSATIGQHPLELAYLAPLIGQAAKTPGLGLKNWGAWLEEKGFHVKKGKVEWEWVKIPANASEAQKQEARRQQVEDVKKLSSYIFNPKAPSIRRKPEDIAGWPKMQTIGMPVNLGPLAMESYNKAWLEFRKEMGLVSSGKNPKGGLAAMLRFRQQISLILVPSTIDYAVELLENGIQPVISAEFKETIDALRSGFRALRLEVSEVSGRVGLDTEKERLRFQRGETRIMLFSVTEAVSFHAKEALPDGSQATPHQRATIVHDMRWSAYQGSQIIGRAHRDGELAIAYFMYAENTVSVKILETMLNKMKNMNILSGEDPEDEALHLAWDLLKSTKD